MALESSDLNTLIESLYDRRGALLHVTSHATKVDVLRQLATAGTHLTIPKLLPILSRDDELRDEAAAAIDARVSGLGPAALAHVDAHARSLSLYQYDPNAWARLTPAVATRIATSLAATYPSVAALFTLHPNGYVRQSALLVLDHLDTRIAIPFLAIRVNDWVDQVAATAATLLNSRLVIANRSAIAEQLPHFLHLLAKTRRDHGTLAASLSEVLMSDGGVELLSRVGTLDAHTRRYAYEMLTSRRTAFTAQALESAIEDPDPTIRMRGVRWLLTAGDTVVPTLQRLAAHDRAPRVRREAAVGLDQLNAGGLDAMVRDWLVDASPSVRDVARAIAQRRALPISPRDVYLSELPIESARRIATALDGLGEIGANQDDRRVEALLSSRWPRVRRTALRALSRLRGTDAVPSAMDALSDESASVRSEAVETLRRHVAAVNFEDALEQFGQISDGRSRGKMLALFAAAPKWDAPTYLLDALQDEAESVRAGARSRLLGWLESFNRTGVQPGSTQLRRISQRLDTLGNAVPADIAERLRFLLRTFTGSEGTARGV